jgi:hypothetical protein
MMLQSSIRRFSQICLQKKYEIKQLETFCDVAQVVIIHKKI